MAFSCKKQKGDNFALFQTVALGSQNYISGRMAENWSASREELTGW